MRRRDFDRLGASRAETVTAARAHTPDVIRSDVDLKRGGTGRHAVEAICRAAGAIPVIYITGTPEDCHPCEAAVAIVGKPIQPAEVLRAFERAYPDC